MSWNNDKTNVEVWKTTTASVLTSSADVKKPKKVVAPRLRNPAAKSVVDDRKPAVKASRRPRRSATVVESLTWFERLIFELSSHHKMNIHLLINPKYLSILGKLSTKA